MGRSWPHDLTLIERLWFIVHVGQRWRDRTLARPVGVVGGSPGLRRWSATGANDEVDDGDPPGTDNFSWDGSNRRLPSPPAATGSCQIPRCAARLALGVRWGGFEGEGS